MKFYKTNNNHIFLIKIKNDKLNAIYARELYVDFYKNGDYHNDKNASFYAKDKKYKTFCLNGKIYGYENAFTKESWRKFAKELKLKVFL
jgi:hypothetical protein